MEERVRIEEEGVAALFHRAVDDGKRLAHAEIAVRIATVRARANGSIPGIGLIVVAILLVIAAIVSLVLALGALLANLLSSVPIGFALAALVALALAALLGKLGAGRISAAIKAPVA